MTAWAETWAPTPREKLTRDALPGLESSWDLVVATAFSFFFLTLTLLSRLQQVMALVLSSDSLEEGKALCPALDPAGSWALASQLSLQHLYMPAYLSVVLVSWWLTASFHSCCLPGIKQQKCLQLRKAMLLKLDSDDQCQCVCPQRKQQMVIRSWAIWMGGEVGYKF